MRAIIRFSKIFMTLTIFTIFVYSIAYADTVLFVFDVSGSMNKTFGAESRIKAAKRVFSEMVRELPKDLNVGLEVYGHYGDKDCNAIELLVPPEPANPDKLINKVNNLKADRGATPIADALRKAADALKNASGNKTIVLITDGIETCGGDPVATLKKLHSEGINVKVHVVGIGVSDLERKQLEQIASAGGGNYYQADDANALSQGLKKIKKQIASHKTRIIFKDGFDKDSLSKDWEIKNPDPDNLIVEEGYLQIVTLPSDNFTNPVNLVLLKKPLPKQYEIIVRLRHTLNIRGYPYTSWYNCTVAGLMLFKDPDNIVMLAVGGYKKQTAVFQKKSKGNWGNEIHYTIGKPIPEREVVLRLQRIKRKFYAWVLNEKGKWDKVGEIPMLRAKGYRLGLFTIKDKYANEAIMKFDEVIVKEIK